MGQRTVFDIIHAESAQFVRRDRDQHGVTIGDYTLSMNFALR